MINRGLRVDAMCRAFAAGQDPLAQHLAVAQNEQMQTQAVGLSPQDQVWSQELQHVPDVLVASFWETRCRAAQQREDLATQRANKLADQCGNLDEANRVLRAENSDLRRKVEKLERKR